MLSATFVSTRITPEIGRRIEARIAGADGLEALPYALKFAEHSGGYRNASTGAKITAQVVDWRDWHYAGQEPRQRPTATKRLDHALERVAAVSDVPTRSWYARPRPKATGTVGMKMAEVLQAQIRASVLRAKS